MAKRCTKCGETKPVEEYHKNPRTGDNLQTRCKSCQNEATRNRDARNRQTIRDLYENQCGVCGQDDPRVLQLDHIHGRGRAQKRFLSHNTVRYTQYVGEHLEEFQLLCANCHAIKTWQDRQDGVFSNDPTKSMSWTEALV